VIEQDLRGCLKAEEEKFSNFERSTLSNDSDGISMLCF